ncbi:hypothetical protein H5410_036097 [Solanum commersonii]|uniref:Integrase core domain containing protein n=1 Tax=Solanum commersonii TaxID=4109 RepID=A0A9J5Y363_SOLCO|nr:hypothetical protein H5410_036097 [Solanum commersonii]
MEGMMDRKVQSPRAIIPGHSLSALQADLASLRTDVNVILAAPSVEPKVAPTALADDTVLDALFISHRTNQETDLEDSTGLLRRFIVCNNSGSLFILRCYPLESPRSVS